MPSDLQYAQNPVEAQKALLEQMLQEKLQPLQQQVETQQQEKFVNDTVGYIQQKYGQSAYEEMRPMMKQILDSTAETSGPEVADLLARNPDSLFMMAFGNAAYQKIIEYNKNQQAGVQNKQNLQRVASGDSRPNRSVKPMVNTGTTSDIEQKVWDYLEANK